MTSKVGQEVSTYKFDNNKRISFDVSLSAFIKFSYNEDEEDQDTGVSTWPCKSLWPEVGQFLITVLKWP